MGADSTAMPFDDYVMGRTSEEYQRLRAQAKIWEPATRRVLQHVGLRDGMSCLDLGCGPGEVMRLMAEMVGPSGRVTGLDVDGRLGREMVDILRITGQAQFNFIEQDVERAEDVLGQPFDVAYARLALLHVRDPIAVLRKMHSWTKPGGCIIVQEHDFGAVGCYPDIESVVEFRRVFFGVYDRAGREARLGLKMPRYFVDAGIGAPDATDVATLLLPIQQAVPMLLAIYRSVLPRALEWGITTEAESRAFFAQMDAAARSNEYCAVLWPPLTAVWKRKPG